MHEKHQYWTRATSSRPWWPWGLMPMLGLLVLFLFGALITAPRIEAEVRQEVQSQFQKAGIRTMQISSDGQAVAVQAESGRNDELYLHALAKSTQCETWAGRLTCPTKVRLDLGEPQADPTAAEGRAHPFTVVREGNSVTLTGEVPNIAEHDRILGVAGQHFDIVSDQLTISNDSARPAYSRAADQALAVVGLLNEGQASWSGETLSVRGVTNSTSIAAVRQQFTASRGGPVQGEFDVRTVDDRRSCNDLFRNILNDATVRFQTGSAIIDEGNEELLERLANTAKSCPGNLTIAGHTDSQGDADMNESLSLARATAVRNALITRGIDAGRLTARGFGESRPVADNTTSTGRARNRRIELTMDITQ